jgi:hypothetical protein
VPEITRFESVGDGPAAESGREITRTSRRSLLVVLAGTVRVVDDLSNEVEVRAPAAVQFWPGEHVAYKAADHEARWLFLESAPRPHPDRFPVPGSRVVMTDEDGSPSLTGTVVHYADTTADQTGVNEIFVEIDGQGVGLFRLDRLVQVREEPQ